MLRGTTDRNSEPRFRVGRKLYIALAILCVSSSLVTSGDLAPKLTAQSRVIDSPTLTKLRAAVQVGRITPEEKSVLQLQFLRDPSLLPLEYKSEIQESPLKCGFEFTQESHALSSGYSDRQSALARASASRPSTQKSVVSSAGHFRLHFDTTGGEAVPVADTDFSGISDFVEKAASYLDSSYAHYHTTLGYLIPPTDSGGGGDNLYDVYFQGIFGYGATYFDVTGPQPWNDYASFIILNKNFQGFPPNFDPEGDALGALKVTCGHEYYHAVQLGYDGGEALWMYESGASWNEDVLFPEVDDNYQFLPAFYSEPQSPLTVSSGLHMYGALVWPQYLAAQHGESIMRTIWEQARYYNDIAAQDSALLTQGTTTRIDFQDFTDWNLFTGSHSRPGYFPNAADYPGPTFDQTLPAPPFTGQGPALAPDGLACNYSIIPTAGAPKGLLRIEFLGSPFVRWGLNVHLRNTVGDMYESHSFVVQTNGAQTALSYNYTTFDSIFVAPVVVSPFSNDNSYTISAFVHPFGDADGSTQVDIGDVTYILAYIFSAGPPPLYDVRLADVDCSSDVNISDAVSLIAYIFLGGSAPCEP